MRHLLPLIALALGSLSVQAQANDLHSVIVGAATGAAGAAIGQSVGGRDGAIIGGAIGGATGAVIAAKNKPQTVVVQQPSRPDYRRTEYQPPHGKAWGHKKHGHKHRGPGHYRDHDD
ncbi:hypothetical protein [Vogesella sp. XCS3]|uniref:hypothetical protein n=1 Tax=Vogesella sp. XCS3 TaxID=2877939 RepID=UPI001D0BDCE9|nr:hypothetical protein [Vogesella sp. XCS3]UDM18139.1 hypothetical protein LCH97_05580 [Vogesella sp. XCS3]